MSKIGVICAVEAELAPFYEHILIKEAKMIGGLEFLDSKLGKREMVFVRSGMGKVNAAIAAMLMIQHYAPELIIICGVAGAIDRKVKLFDTLVCARSTHHDLPMGAIISDYPKMEDEWFIADADFVAKVRAVSNCKTADFILGEIFVNNDVREVLAPRFCEAGIALVDMETAAVAQCARAMGVPFASVRAVSDTPDNEGMDEFWKNVQKAAKKACEVVVKAVK